MPSVQQKPIVKPQIIPETPFHAGAIERVLDRAFGPGRFSKISERVREIAAHAPTLSRVALQDGAVVGVCGIYRVSIGETPALFLGPLAVDPDAQHGGIGHALVSAVLDVCRADEAGLVFLMGQPAFFNTLGFVQVPDGRVVMPGPAEPRRLLWRSLKDGALDDVSGIVGRPR